MRVHVPPLTRMALRNGRVIMSHRGQGESGRMTSDPQMGYVEYFDDYVADLGSSSTRS